MWVSGIEFRLLGFVPLLYPLKASQWTLLVTIFDIISK